MSSHWALLLNSCCWCLFLETRGATNNQTTSDTAQLVPHPRIKSKSWKATFFHHFPFSTLSATLLNLGTNYTNIVESFTNLSKMGSFPYSCPLFSAPCILRSLFQCLKLVPQPDGRCGPVQQHISAGRATLEPLSEARHFWKGTIFRPNRTWKILEIRLLRVSKCIKAYLKSLPCAQYYFHKIAGNAETLSSATSIVLVGWPMILWIVFVPKWSTSLSTQVELKHWSVAAHPGPKWLDHVWTHKLDSSWMVGCSRWPNFWVHW